MSKTPFKSVKKFCLHGRSGTESDWRADPNHEQISSQQEEPSTCRYAPTTLIKGKEFVPVKCTHFNAQSLRGKFAEFQELVESEQYDIIGVSETWFSKDINDAEFTPAGYKCFRTDRKLDFYPPGTYTNEQHGGVALIVKEELHPERYEAGDTNAEIVWVKISPNPKISLLCGVAYHPDRGGMHNMSYICESINKCDSANLLLLGDFNLRDISWSTMEGRNDISRKFIETIEDNLLTQLVDESTRGENLIDLVITGNTEIIDEVRVELPFSTSDHSRTDVDLNIPLPRVESAPRTVYLYSKGNYSGMDKELGDMDWENMFKNKSLNSQWNIYKEEYCRLRDKYIPHKKVKVGARITKPWTRYKSVRKAKDQKKKAWK